MIQGMFLTHPRGYWIVLGYKSSQHGSSNNVQRGVNIPRLEQYLFVWLIAPESSTRNPTVDFLSASNAVDPVHPLTSVHYWPWREKIWRLARQLAPNSPLPCTAQMSATQFLRWDLRLGRDVAVTSLKMYVLSSFPPSSSTLWGENRTLVSVQFSHLFDACAMPPRNFRKIMMSKKKKKLSHPARSEIPWCIIS